MKSDQTTEKVNKKKDKKSVGKILASVGSIVIFVLLIIAFLVPYTARDTNGKAVSFGSWDGKKVELDNTYFLNMLSQYGEQAKQNQQNEITVYSQAFQATIRHLAIEEFVNKSGISIPTSLINRTMLPAFYDANGVYSPKIFRDTPESEKINYAKSIKTALMDITYSQDLFGANADDIIYESALYGIKTSTKEIPFIAEMGSKQRAFDAVIFPTKDYPQSEVIAYANENAALFTTYDLSIISVATEKEALDISKKIEKEQISFEDAESEYSTKNYSTDGKFTNKYEYQIKTFVTSETDFATLKALQPNAITKPIAITNGYAIFKCNASPVNADFTNETVINVVKLYIQSNEAGRIEEYYTNIAKDFSSAATLSSFEQACTDFNVEKVSVDAFPCNYNNNYLLGFVPSNTYEQITGAETNENFLKTAFSLKQDEISSPIVINGNVIVMKFVELKDESEDVLANEQYIYPFYSSAFDRNSLALMITNHEKFENNFFNEYFSLMNN